MTFTGKNVLQSLTVLSWVGPVSAAALRVHRRAASGSSLRAEDTEVRQMGKLRKNIFIRLGVPSMFGSKRVRGQVFSNKNFIENKQRGSQKTAHGPV